MCVFYLLLSTCFIYKCIQNINILYNISIVTFTYYVYKCTMYLINTISLNIMIHYHLIYKYVISKKCLRDQNLKFFTQLPNWHVSWFGGGFWHDQIYSPMTTKNVGSSKTILFLFYRSFTIHNIGMTIFTFNFIILYLELEIRI